MAKIPHLVLIGLLLRDTSAGEVRVGRDGEPVVHYRLNDVDMATSVPASTGPPGHDRGDRPPERFPAGRGVV